MRKAIFAIKTHQEWDVDIGAARKHIFPITYMESDKCRSLSFQYSINDFAHDKHEQKVLIFKLIHCASTVHLLSSASNL
jgi:hypothetical protein